MQTCHHAAHARPIVGRLPDPPWFRFLIVLIYGERCPVSILPRERRAGPPGTQSAECAWNGPASIRAEPAPGERTVDRYGTDGGGDGLVHPVGIEGDPEGAMKASV